MIEPVPWARQDLRRYVMDEKSRVCPGDRGWHNAVAQLGEIAWEVHPKYDGSGYDDFDHADPRWPRVCQTCGFAFRDKDPWQHNLHGLWSRVGDHSSRFVLEDAPPGAMWVARWYGDIPDWCGPDGQSLEVMLPDGCRWGIDTPSRGGGKWTRSGTAPLITANPSILTPGYHGFLRGGWLEAC